jgi:hypothetical protein
LAVAKGGIIGLALFAFSFASVVAINPFSGDDVEKAQAQEQTGLINVNLQDVNLQIPVSVAVPVSVAANVCGVNVLGLQGVTECDAQSNSMALSRAIAFDMTGQGQGAGGGPQQTGLVNVNIEDLNLQVPVSVAVPISVAANVCGINILGLQGLTECDAHSSSDALSRAIALNLAQQ